MILIPSTHPRLLSKNNRHKVMRNNLPPGAVYVMRLYAVSEIRGNNHASTSCHLGLLPLPCDKEVPPLSDAKKDYTFIMSN